MFSPPFDTVDMRKGTYYPKRYKKKPTKHCQRIIILFHFIFLFITKRLHYFNRFIILFKNKLDVKLGFNLLFDLFFFYKLICIISFSYMKKKKQRKKMNKRAVK